MSLRPWRRPAIRPEPLARADVVGVLVRSAIERDGVASWRARGRSMAQAITDGDVVRLVGPGAEVRRGDVVMAALPDGRLVLHRVRRVVGDTVVLQGDACRRADPPVHRSDIIAVSPSVPAFSARSYIRRVRG